MDYTCDKCGATVQEGRAFCPNCNAPQIRVSVPDPSPSFEPGTPAGMQPPAQPVPLRASVITSPTSIDWSAGWPAVLIAALVSTVGSIVPLGLLWVIGCGALAVLLYKRRRPGYMRIGTSTGAKLGAVTGVFGCPLAILVEVAKIKLSNIDFWGQLTQALKQQAGPNPDANVQQMFEIIKTPEGKAMIACFIMIFAFALFLALSTLGGAIGAAFVGRDQHSN